MRITIRRITAADIGMIRVMSGDFLAELPFNYPKLDGEEIDTRMFELLNHIGNPEAIDLIAFDGKKPAGFFIGYVGNKPYSQPRRVGVAQELYVVPEKRGNIVGLRLMEEAARIAISLGAQGLECIGTYNGTDKRWEKFGFKPHVVYGHMDNNEFMALVQRFTKRKAA